MMTQAKDDSTKSHIKALLHFFRADYLDKAPSNDTKDAENDSPATELPLNDTPEFSEDTPE